MITVAACDDDNTQRNSLKVLIDRTLSLLGTEYRIIEFECGEALLRKSTSLDILFLDIEMPGINGVETAKLIRQTNNHAVIIFVTSYPDYVFQGYEVKALNYILKPYKESKIIELLKEALVELKAKAEQYYMLEQKSGMLKLALNEVFYFQSDRRNIVANTKGGVITFYHKLNELEKELPAFFVRIHNRYLVNMNYVTQVNADVVVCTGQHIPISRAYQQSVFIAFAKMMLK